MLNNLKSKEEGFSLFEMLLSITILALLSAFILQMFVVSSKANNSARDMDVASTIAISAIEELKSCNFENDFFNNDFIVDTKVSFGLSDFFDVNEKLSFSNFDFSKGLMLYKYFDKNWGLLTLTESEEDLENPKNSDVKFILAFSVSRDQEEELTWGNFYNISAKVFSVNKVEDNKEIASYESGKYFALVGEIYGQ